MKKKFNFENKNLDLHIEKISVEKATKIDFNSDSFIKKAQTIFNELSIKVIDDENIIFDSEKNNYNDLNFNLCLKIIQNIESELCLNEKEALQYQNLCIDFLNDKHDKMPYELILAKDILNKNLTFNFSDYSKMEMKTYEKIQLGLIILRETSDNKINQEWIIMTPEEVAAVYLRQALLLESFIEKIKSEDFSEEQYKLMLLMICERYHELLQNLAFFTPLLNSYKVKFYNLNCLESKLNLKEPPFEKDFFNEIR